MKNFIIRCLASVDCFSLPEKSSFGLSLNFHDRSGQVGIKVAILIFETLRQFQGA